MLENPIEITKASEIKRLKDRVFFKLFEIVPASLSWLTLLLAFLLSWLAPVSVAFFIIAFDLFWLIRILYLSFHQIVSFQKLKQNLKIDWVKKLKIDYAQNWQSIYYLIVLPTYK